MVDQVQITPATQSHLDVLIELARKTFEDTFGHLNEPGPFQAYMNSAFSREKISSELDKPASDYYLIYYQGQLTGYLKLNTAMGQTDIKDPESLEIERIYVDSSFQGLGLGKALFEFSVQKARNLQLSYIWLGVWEKNEKALRFYKSRGFYQFSDHPFKLGDELQTDYLMRLDL